MFIPGAGVFNVTPEGIDRMVRALAPLVDPDDEALLEPQLQPAHREVVGALEALPWEHPDVAANLAMEILVAAVDPADDLGDVPWTAALTQLTAAPRIGSRLARRWFTYLYRLRAEDHRVSVVQEAVAAYGVAAFERLLEREHEVARWLRTASLVTDYEGRPMLGIVVLLRAARLLQLVLRRWPPRSSP